MHSTFERNIFFWNFISNSQGSVTVLFLINSHQRVVTNKNGLYESWGILMHCFLAPCRAFDAVYLLRTEPKSIDIHKRIPHSHNAVICGGGQVAWWTCCSTHYSNCWKINKYLIGKIIRNIYVEWSHIKIWQRIC